MENIIFYAPYLVCTILLFVIASNYTKINKHKSNVQFWHEAYDEVSKRIQEMTAQITDLKTLLGIREESIEVFKSAINERDEKIETLIESNNNRKYSIEKFIKVNEELCETIQNQSNAMQKQSDEIIILKEQNESLTNHLQEQLEKHEGAKPKPKTKKGLKINYPDKNDFRNNV